MASQEKHSSLTAFFIILLESLMDMMVLPSCRALFRTVAPLGRSWLQADLKNGSTCRQTSSPGFSHIPRKSCTFSSSRETISESFCFKRSEQQRHTARKPFEPILSYFSIHTGVVNALPPLISLALVSSCRLSSSVSLGIPSSSSFSLSNQSNQNKIILILIIHHS